MIPLHSSWFQWGHGEVIYIPFFSKKKTPQHHSNTPQCLDCRRSAIATLHQRLAHWRSATRPRKWHKCWSYEAYEETLEKLQSTPHSTSCSMILFSSYSTYLTNFSLIFSCILPTVWTLAYFEGAPRQQKVFQGLHFDLERLDNTMILCLYNLRLVWSHLHGSKALSRKSCQKHSQYLTVGLLWGVVYLGMRFQVLNQINMYGNIPTCGSYNTMVILA